MLDIRKFNYNNLPRELLNIDIMNLVSKIHEFKGKEDLFIAAKPDILDSMCEMAKIQSTGASNRIEGIYTSDDRLEAIVMDKTDPRNRSEREIAGYREVLNIIHENYNFMNPSVNVILQMHRDLYRFSASDVGGSFKNSDNIIAETDSKGTTLVRFRPVTAFETPLALELLTKTLFEALSKNECDPLILISMFILDFLCIHPFNDGNGRISRLLTLLLLYRSGYIVGKYVSIEKIIESTKESYYISLRESSDRWHEAKNTYLPFVKYNLEIILSAYKDFSSRVEHLQNKPLSKSERIKILFDNTLKKLSKKDIKERCPDISISTIELVLHNLLQEEYVIKVGAGKNTSYIKNTEN